MDPCAAAAVGGRGARARSAHCPGGDAFIGSYVKELPRLGFVGVGAIAEALIAGLCAGGEQRGTFLLSPRNAQLSKGLAERFAFVKVAADNQAVVDGSDIVFLAVTPQIA